MGETRREGKRGCLCLCCSKGEMTLRIARRVEVGKRRSGPRLFCVCMFVLVERWGCGGSF